MTRLLTPAPLTPKGFSPFGEVIDTAAADPLLINQGFASRFDDLADIDVEQEGGRPCLSIFRARARAFPLAITMMERHPLGSQAFMPLSGNPFLVVVAPAGDAPPFEGLQAFLAGPGQGVNYRRGVWHFPLIALHEGDSFLVIDRAGPGDNLEEAELGEATARIADPGA
ncbi:MAG: ureidoglycolate lyase [Hyphomicrobiales bacterium]|nr:MAG: ureidoglycolate lyase [Hyphomicrobiales bacterium]